MLRFLNIGRRVEHSAASFLIRLAIAIAIAMPVVSKARAVRALMAKANKDPSEADGLDWESYNEEHLMIGDNVKLSGVEYRIHNSRSCPQPLQFVLQNGNCFVVDIKEKITNSGTVLICSAYDIWDVRFLGPGCIKTDSTGFSGRGCDIMMLPMDRSDVPKGQGSNSGGDRWPSGIMNFARSRTLPELIQDGKEFLNAGAPRGHSIKVYAGFKHYLTTGQMVAFVLQGQENGSIKMLDAVSFGSEPLAETTVALLRGEGAEPRGLGFGNTGPCSELGLPNYKLSLPSESLFYGAEPFSVGFPSSIDIDLYMVKRNITATTYCELLEVENVVKDEAAKARMAERQERWANRRKADEAAKVEARAAKAAARAGKRKMESGASSGDSRRRRNVRTPIAAGGN